MKRLNVYLGVVVFAFLTACAHKPTTTQEDSDREEYERVRKYCRDASNPLGMRAVTPNHDAQAPVEFDNDVVGYDDCMRRYWPENQPAVP